MIRAVLFDMDGVLFDTEALGQRAMMQISRELGYPISETFYLNTLGVPDAECRAIYQKGMGADFPYDEASVRFRTFFFEYNRAHALPRKPGLMECLTGLKARGIKIALVTSTVRPLVMEYFAAMPDVAVCFDTLVCGGEVPHGKPAPDMYLAAANALGCVPAECVGVEDSYSGVQSIRASGARCVMIPDLLPCGERFAPYVDDCLPSLTDLCPLVERLNSGTSRQT
ncbi:MAG: HAD family phosphatase [Eubacteriales bacterium]|nr:HAD family phosphatase [Eubacteriales bacterium]